MNYLNEVRFSLIHFRRGHSITAVGLQEDIKYEFTAEPDRRKVMPWEFIDLICSVTLNI